MAKHHDLPSGARCTCSDCVLARARADEQHRAAHSFASNGKSDRAGTGGCVWPKECHCAMCEVEKHIVPTRQVQPLAEPAKMGTGPFRALAFRRSKRDPVMQRCAFCGDDIIGQRAMVHLMAGVCMLGQVCGTDKCTQGVIRVLMEALPFQSIVLVDKDGVEVRLPK